MCRDRRYNMERFAVTCTVCKSSVCLSRHPAVLCRGTIQGHRDLTCTPPPHPHPPFRLTTHTCTSALHSRVQKHISPSPTSSSVSSSGSGFRSASPCMYTRGFTTRVHLGILVTLSEEHPLEARCTLTPGWVMPLSPR